MPTPHDELVAAIRAGLARCPRQFFRTLSLGLDPDECELAERVVAQTVLEELSHARFEIRKPLAHAMVSVEPDGQ